MQVESTYFQDHQSYDISLNLTLSLLAATLSSADIKLANNLDPDQSHILFDTLIVFLKDFFENVTVKNQPRRKVLFGINFGLV